MKSRMFNKTKPRSNQDAFNRVWRFFIIDGHQQCKAGGSETQCAYRGRKKGEACAVGCMMPQKMAKAADSKAATHSTDIEAVSYRMPSVKKWFSRVDIQFLKQLQEAHDSNLFNDSKESKLRVVADSWNLKIPKH